MKKGLLVLFLLGLTLKSQAFMTVQESNEITPSGQLKLGIEPQFLTSGSNGTNATAFLDARMNEEMSARALVGAGDTDLALGASLKWVPYPDTEDQPAVGGKIGAYYWRESDENFTTLRIEPIVSKKVQTEIGEFIPYASFPVMINSGKDKNNTGIQLAAGSEFRHPEADNMTFGLEGGIDAKDSFSYISGYVTIYMEDSPVSSSPSR